MAGLTARFEEQEEWTISRRIGESFFSRAGDVRDVRRTEHAEKNQARARLHAGNVWLVPVR